MKKNIKNKLTQDQVIIFEGNNNELWEYAGDIKAYTDNLEIKRRLSKVVGAKLVGTYGNVPNSLSKKGLGWDFLFPMKRLDTVIRILSKDKNIETDENAESFFV